MSALFSPAKIGGLNIENRIVVSPMCTYSAIDGIVQPWHFLHLGSMMMSGAGLVIMEATAVEDVGRGTHGCTGIYNDEQEVALHKLVGQLRNCSNAAIGIQLTHTGRKAATRTIPDRWQGEPLPLDEGAWKPQAPSAIAYDEGWQIPEELDEAGIKRIIAAFADAAQRALRAGFDLIEIHGAHGYLIHSFLSPLTNKRTDAWGGSTDNRNRFALEIARAVRTVWPREKALGFRLNSTDWVDGGSTLEDAVELASQLENEGIDYVVMSSGNIAPGIQIPPASPGHQVPFATAINANTNLTTMAVGMILHPEQAEEIAASGQADFVAIARAMLDNPRWAIHAAATLGDDIHYPSPYLRARPNNWIGFSHIHRDARPPQTTHQLDRPRSVSSWDRPSTPNA
jgi:2,4-dienoyl-CoA reductase-like NADH-dependent reductase (Old Yellow Enzyme family)